MFWSRNKKTLFQYRLLTKGLTIYYELLQSDTEELNCVQIFLVSSVTKMAFMPIYGDTLKNFFTGTASLMTQTLKLKLGFQ